MKGWGRGRWALVPVVVGAVALSAVGLGSLTGCGRTHQPSADGVIRVVVGFYPLEYVARQVGGDRVRVTNLARPGAEPHDLELSPRQVATVADADLVVYLAGFQPAVDQATELEAADRAFDVGLTVRLRPVMTTSSTPGEPEREEVTASGGKDPHLWLNPLLLAQVAEAVAGRLAALDPTGAAGYRQRAGELRTALTILDIDYRQGLRDCARRDIVVSHAAFGYLADRYGLNQIPIAGLSPDTEPTVGRLAEVAAQARQRQATTIFFESLASPKVAQAIAAEVGLVTSVLDPIEGLRAGSPDTYLTVMRANLVTLVRALGCP